MFLRTPNGIKEVTKFRRFKSVFCKHRNLIAGISCSKNGMSRISGIDSYVICNDCGLVMSESHTNYF